MANYEITFKVKAYDVAEDSYFHDEPEHYLWDHGMLDNPTIVEIKEVND